ncbi:MAG TPA: ribonuclease III [Phycisphaerae bacterium]|nr:ribonuclease III [Phycisphaerae bacterium]
MSDDVLARCQEIIGYRFSDPLLLRQALTHASAAPTRSESNERLEFLGDAVLGLVVCQYIFDRDGELPEGEMTKIKSSVVSRRTCARFSNNLGLTELMSLGKGIGTARTLPPSIPAAVYEAVIGAIFLDGGFEEARRFILSHIAEEVDDAVRSRHQKNYKSLLQQHAQREWDQTPQYDLLDEKGPEHFKCFEVAVRVNGRQYTSAWGPSKKEAEQKAALAALVELGLIGPEQGAE